MFCDPSFVDPKLTVCCAHISLKSYGVCYKKIVGHHSKALKCDTCHTWTFLGLFVCEFKLHYFEQFFKPEDFCDGCFPKFRSVAICDFSGHSSLPQWISSLLRVQKPRQLVIIPSRPKIRRRSWLFRCVHSAVTTNVTKATHAGPCESSDEAIICPSKPQFLSLAQITASLPTVDAIVSSKLVRQRQTPRTQISTRSMRLWWPFLRWQ